MINTITVDVDETTGEDLDKLLDAVQKLDEEQLLIGITDETSSRDGEISNAELAYIHTNGVRARQMRHETDAAVRDGKPYPMALQAYIEEHGSPAFNVPPRPFIEPAIEKHLDLVEAVLKDTLLDILDGGDGKQQLNELGLELSAQVKNYFQEDNGWPPNSAKTVARKKSDQPLVVTGTLRQSITYVIRKVGETK